MANFTLSPIDSKTVTIEATNIDKLPISLQKLANLELNDITQRNITASNKIAPTLENPFDKILGEAGWKMPTGEGPIAANSKFLQEKIAAAGINTVS